MRYRFSSILLLFFCLLPPESLAASKTILRLGSFQHWADLSYGYTHEGSSGPADETEHLFEERYTFLGKYVVLEPDIWHGDFEVGLGLEQESTEEQTGRSEKKNGYETEYQVNGMLFSRRPASIGFSALSRTRRRSQFNAPDYDLRNERYRASLSLRNDLLPTRLIYTISTSETDGLSIDRRTDVDQFTILTRNSAGPSQTELNLNFARRHTDFSGEAASESSTDSDFSLENHLELPSRRRPGTLDTHLSYTEEEGGNMETERFDWSENLAWRLGRALSSGLRLGMTKSDITLSGRRNDTETRSVGAFLQHQLFQSLVSRLDLSGQKQETDDGSQEEERTGLDLSYRKRLGENATMTLGAGVGYGITDRNYEAGLRTAVGLNFTVQEVDNFLPDTGILAETVAIRDADRSVIYLEGTDYLLRTTGRVTELVIPLGSVIVPGQVLSIDYEFLVDPSVRYETRVLRSSGALNLQNNRLQFFYQFAESRQELLDGEAPAESLSDSRFLRAGAAAQSGGHRLRLTYGYQRTMTNPSDFVEGTWNYSGTLRQGRWAAQVTDTYTWYRAQESGGGSENNGLSASTTYSRRWGNKSLNTRAFYSNTNGRNINREKLAMEVEYVLSFGKSQVSMNAGIDWNWNNGFDSRSDRLQIRLRRFF